MARKVVLVTGAGSGIGAAAAVELANPDCIMILHTASNQEGLVSVAAHCSELGAVTCEVLGDLSDGQTAGAITKVIGDHQALDVFVSNAGYPEWRPMGVLTESDYRKSLEVTQLALFKIVNDNLELLKKSQQGRVIAVSSFLAHRFELGGDYVPATAAAKAGLEALVKSMAAQLAQDGVTVNAVVPGYIKKNSPNHVAQSEEGLKRILGRIPLDRLGQPQEVANLIAFLASEKAAYITGQSIQVDGGLTL